MPLELYININRTHPLLVHLPIGMLCLALLLEGIQWRTKRRDLEEAISITLYSSLLAALFSVVTGWFLGGEGGYDENMLFWHKWLAIGMTSLLALICGLRWVGRVGETKWLLIVATMLLFVAGHFGGSLTHGTDYLFSNAVEEPISVADIQKANAYTTIIQPVLKQKCNGCHNPSKAKGELVMTSVEGLRAGGETGALFDLKKPLKSLLLTRIHLPKTEKKHMPPKGKKQLTEEETKLLEWWLKNEACFDCLVGEMEHKEEVAPILAKYNMPRKANLKPLTPITPSQLETLRKADIAVQPLSTDNPYVIVNLAENKTLDKKTFKTLRKIGDHVLELNLQNTNFSDELASWLQYFPQLQKLQIQNTSISNNSISVLKKLKNLQSLNLYGTAINDDAISTLVTLPALQRLYCWQSKITKNGVENLQKEKPQLQIQHQYDDELFGGAILNPPKILASTFLFKDTVHVRLTRAFKGASIFYTLDGSTPDTTSTLYTDSIVISSTTILNTYCYKKGWESSAVSDAHFRKSGILIKTIKLSANPPEDYKGRKGARTLIDMEQGGKDLKDGKWLGYQGKHLTIVAELDSLQEIRMAALSAMSAPGPWIFYPKGIKIWTSKDGKQYMPAAEDQYDIEEENNFRENRYFDLTFEPRQAHYVKMQITSRLKNPDWHPSAGEDCWLFVDEMVVE